MRWIKNVTEWRDDRRKCREFPDTGTSETLAWKSSAVQCHYFPHSMTFRLTVVLILDNSPAVERFQGEGGVWLRKRHPDKFEPWADETVAKITEFGKKSLGLQLTGFLRREGFVRLEFHSGPALLRPLDILSFSTKNRAADAFAFLKAFLERETGVRTTASKFDLEWTPDRLHQWPRQKLERKFGWAFYGASWEMPRPVPRKKFYADVMKGAYAALGFYLGTKFDIFQRLFGRLDPGPTLGDVYGETIGTPTQKSEFEINITINNEDVPARPLELAKWMNLWKQHYGDEYGHRVYALWQQGSNTLNDAAREAATEMEKILNDIGCGKRQTWHQLFGTKPFLVAKDDIGPNGEYYVAWRLEDQILQVVDNGDGTGYVRIRPLVYDLLYRSIAYPTDAYLVKDGVVDSFPPTHLIGVVSGQDGYKQAVEPPPQDCSNPFGGQCESGCLVGCETMCEGNPCQFSCQGGCQTSCETTCMTCANNALLCGYNLTCDCTDNGNGTVDVTGRVTYDQPGGVSPMPGEDVSIYHVSWGTSYHTTTDSDGYYSRSGLPQPASGSTPIYVNWDDPNGTQHQCSTSTCFCSLACCSDSDCPSGQVCCNGSCQECCSDSDCPSGQVCVNGQCQDTGGGGTPYISNITWETSALCTDYFRVFGTVRDSSGARTQAYVYIYVNGNKLTGPDSGGVVNGGWLTDSRGDFDITVQNSEYTAECSNTVEVVPYDCTSFNSGTCSGATPPGQAESKIVVCNANYGITCGVSNSQPCIGDIITFSGHVTDNTGVCGNSNVAVKIFKANIYQATVYTDSNGDWSYDVSFSSAGAYALRAETPDGTACSKAVDVQACAPQRNIEITVHADLCGSITNTYSVTVKDADTGGSLATATYSRISVGGYKVLENRYTPTHPTGPTTTWCSDFDSFCSNLNLKPRSTKKEVKNKLFNQLNYPGKNLTPSQIGSIIAEAERLAVDLARRYFVEHYDLRHCPNSNTCKSWGSTALLRTCTSGTFGHSEYKNSNTITV